MKVKTLKHLGEVFPQAIRHGYKDFRIFFDLCPPLIN
jgi:hypothetical protein